MAAFLAITGPGVSAHRRGRFAGYLRPGRRLFYSRQNQCVR
jgi:hypothetical protein